MTSKERPSYQETERAENLNKPPFYVATDARESRSKGNYPTEAENAINAQENGREIEGMQ